MACISMPTAMLGGSLLSGAGSLLGGIMNSGAASQAAQLQQQAGLQASQNEYNMFDAVSKDLQPYMNKGIRAANQLSQLTGTNVGGNPLTAALTAKFQPTMAQLEQTPGYQFTKEQGLEAAQNGFAAQGLGSSGAAIKGGVNYAEGLASTTYQQQFQNYLTQNQQIYNMIAGQSQQGLQAGALNANLGMQAAGQAGNYLTSAAAAGAAGIMGSTSALSSGISGGLGSLGSSLGTYGLLNSLGLGGSLGGGSTGGIFANNDMGMAASAGLSAGLTYNPDGSIS